MPHLHLSLQAGDDMILKRMKRRHLRADAIRFCDDVRRLRPDVAFGADLIAGFPTETEAMFENTRVDRRGMRARLPARLPLLAACGTPAARMPQLPRQLVKQRAARLREVGDRALARRLAAEVARRAPCWSSGPASAAPSISHPLRSMQARPARSCRCEVESAGLRELLRPRAQESRIMALERKQGFFRRLFGTEDTRSRARSRTLPTPLSSLERCRPSRTTSMLERRRRTRASRRGPPPASDRTRSSPLPP